MIEKPCPMYYATPQAGTFAACVMEIEHPGPHIGWLQKGTVSGNRFAKGVPIDFSKFMFEGREVSLIVWVRTGTDDEWGTPH